MTTETLRALVDAATKAPSSHNTQPWSFALTADAVELRADRTRALPVNDPYDRELTISCGAALFQLRVAAAHAQLGAEVDLGPTSDDEDVLATVRVVDRAPEAGLAGLFPAIAARFTTREAFSSERELPGESTRALVAAATAEGAALHVVDGAGRAEIAALVAEGDRAQFADPSWRRELAAWMHPRRTGDGMPVAWGALTVTRLVVRTFDLGGSTATKDHELVRQAPLVTVVSTAGDEVRDWLIAGQALGRALLEAATRGFAAGYANQPCQVSALRPRLTALLPTGRVPQLVLRFGAPAGVGRRAPRRALDDVLAS